MEFSRVSLFADRRRRQGQGAVEQFSLWLEHVPRQALALAAVRMHPGVEPSSSFYPPDSTFVRTQNPVTGRRYNSNKGPCPCSGE